MLSSMGSRNYLVDPDLLEVSHLLKASLHHQVGQDDGAGNVIPRIGGAVLKGQCIEFRLEYIDAALGPRSERIVSTILSAQCRLHSPIGAVVDPEDATFRMSTLARDLTNFLS